MSEVYINRCCRVVCPMDDPLRCSMYMTFFKKIQVFLCLFSLFLCFFRLRSTTKTLTTHAHSHPYEYTYKSYPYEHLRRLSQQILEIDEVTTCGLLSTGTLPTTECTTPLNSRIFAFMGSRILDLRCYRDSCNH